MPDNRNPMFMSREAITEEIGELRNSVEVSARRIHELSRVLYDQVRRDRDRTNLGVYITYANSWIRFSGMVLQGLQRTRMAERVLRLLPEEAKPASQERQAPAPAQPQPVAPQAPAPDDPLRDFIELYGEEMVRNADGQR